MGFKPRPGHPGRSPRPVKGNIFRLFAAFLSLLFTVNNGLFVYAAESEFWTARRQATRNARTLRPAPTLLAQLPVGAASRESLLPPATKTTDWRPVETGDSSVPVHAAGGGPIFPNNSPNSFKTVEPCATFTSRNGRTRPWSCIFRIFTIRSTRKKTRPR